MKRVTFIGGALDGQQREDRPGPRFYYALSVEPIGCGKFTREVYARTGDAEFTFQQRSEPLSAAGG